MDLRWLWMQNSSVSVTSFAPRVWHHINDLLQHRRNVTGFTTWTELQTALRDKVTLTLSASAEHFPSSCGTWIKHTELNRPLCDLQIKTEPHLIHHVWEQSCCLTAPPTGQKLPWHPHFSPVSLSQWLLNFLVCELLRSVDPSVDLLLLKPETLQVCNHRFDFDFRLCRLNTLLTLYIFYRDSNSQVNTKTF